MSRLMFPTTKFAIHNSFHMCQTYQSDTICSSLESLETSKARFCLLRDPGTIRARRAIGLKAWPSLWTRRRFSAPFSKVKPDFCNNPCISKSSMSSDSSGKLAVRLVFMARHLTIVFHIWGSFLHGCNHRQNRGATISHVPPES